MRDDTRATLDYIDTVLSQGSVSARELWDVLAALRGPDRIENGVTKENTTVHIRSAAFPKTANAVNNGYCNIAAAFSSHDNPFMYPENGGHFVAHIRYAAFVLGLKNEV
jgi:hypothetical protein